MSPLEIRILLHYSWSALDYHQVEGKPHAESPAVADAIEKFLAEGLLTSRYSDISWAIRYAALNDIYFGNEIEKPVLKITDKGRAMVEHLCAVKIPVCKWIQPEATP